ncbi:hypothetical protein EFP35_01225 [Lactiplantibacillus pentosus]|uniref:hypothetical protein n=1 Tax=Lactiplantibacillus pentosus TaxID=1589 RepID=UPI001CFFD137|nr:hypothetical protein [Lactiplantibacillus pentosus]MCB5220310.1 hypothetical protein [Lactiplantibacillus pentosus]MCT3288686.1 hypothetical protein [Lactiplantibacillus pentosus]
MQKLISGLKRWVALGIVKNSNLNCPKCMSSHVRRIVYGLVSSLGLAGSQAYYLAGCDIPETGMKAFQCDNCQFEFGDVNTDELVRNREKLNACSEDWRLFAEGQPLTLYGRLPVINLDKFSLDDIIAMREHIQYRHKPDTIIDHFYCDWKESHGVWFWLYRDGDVFRIDTHDHCLVRDTEYLRTDSYLYDDRNETVYFNSNTIVEVTADEFYQQLRKQLLSVPHRYGQVALAQYKGSTSPLWQHDELYSAEVLFDHTFRIQDGQGKSHFLTLNRELAHQTAAVVYADRGWRVSYEALMAVDVATMRA